MAEIAPKPRDRDAMQAEALRRQVRQMVEAGYSVAKIMKATGKSYVHISRIVAQEKQP